MYGYPNIIVTITHLSDSSHLDSECLWITVRFPWSPESPSGSISSPLGLAVHCWPLRAVWELGELPRKRAIPVAVLSACCLQGSTLGIRGYREPGNNHLGPALRQQLDGEEVPSKAAACSRQQELKDGPGLRPLWPGREGGLSKNPKRGGAVRAGKGSRVGGAGSEAERGAWKQERQAPPPGAHWGAGCCGEGHSAALISGPLHAPKNYVGPRELLFMRIWLPILTTLEIRPEKMCAY